MTSPGGNTRKRTLAFVSEGVTDLETQRAREQVEQAKFEAECKRRERKSLREQLKANAISKQKEFSGLVKERDGINRLSDDELAHIRRLAEQDRQRERDLKEYLESHSKGFTLRQRQLAKEQPVKESLPPQQQASARTNKLDGVVKVGKPIRKKLKLKLTPSRSRTPPKTTQ
ncbi:hypothetical protein HG536_0D02960 [Torulaspora globosa]|uniref:FAM192A/Fyv6 N-terminal domain-containing protein n=1 Tax=Torulaspora globosa TaxID=48254 RepID=A0A7G3ZGY8_9SACH|nr:uncharacterized protein HG536_0D02960 [Torulaspora globosa]QLL32774.1 hypothetical protein HG536_0D02960 [Torulaspora globosa]